MKILVTGASGFVGRHVIRRLLGTEHTIVATALEERVNVSDSVDADKLVYVPCDLNRENVDYHNLFGRPDAIIHLSWEGLPRYGELFHIERNLPSNYRFLKSLVEAGLKDVTVIGTCLEYGLQNGRLSEDMCPQPSTPYAVAKDSLRRFLEELRKKSDFAFRWIRIFYTYGEGQNKNAILEQLKIAVGRGDKVFDMSRGNQLRDYLAIEKVAEHIVRIALQRKVLGVINCCSGKPVSIRELVESQLKAMNAQISLHLGVYDYPSYEPMAFWGDTSKLQSIINDEH
jgi:dTDP-6-deoxy-L-talose 4-dehydrogenase (NAD+)